MGQVRAALGYLKWLVLAVVVFSLATNFWVVLSTRNEVYDQLQNVPFRKVALVLGTSRYVVGGDANPYFYHRIEAAADLYEMGKVRHILVSGDNRTRFYNEPLEMQKALIQLGVPDSAITLDYAGLRTFDSVVRCKEIFGQSEVTIITQKFHNYRAVFIGQHNGMNAVGYVARRVPWNQSFRILIREYFARSKAILDLFLLGTKPRHLGKKEDLSV